MKLIFFNRFFFPDLSATSQILSDLAFHLAAQGHDVHVVTSRVPDGEAELAKERGVTIHRVSEAPSGPHSLLHRARAYVAFYFGARKLAASLISPGDIVVLKTDPPMLSSAVGPIAVRKRAILVNWLQDVFPEVAERYGIPGTGGLTGGLLRRLRNRSLRMATRTVVIGDQMAEHVKALGAVAPDKVEVIHNWANGELIRPVMADANTLRKKWALDKTFVIGYSGNLGRVHEFDTLLGAAKLLKKEQDICFLIVGHGPRHGEVVKRAVDDRLSNVRFEPHQDIDSLSESLCVADVHVSTLSPDFEGLVHPSKLYGVMAAGRPTLFIGDVKGETARILAETDAGLTVQTGNCEELAAAIVRLRDDPRRCQTMGEHAREAFQLKYDRPVALAKWEALLNGVGAPA